MINTYLINNYNNKFWFKNDKCHHNGDLPAIEFANGIKWWYKNGKHHRDGDLPAVEWFDGKCWYKNGKLHRDGNLPTIEYSNGNKSWYKNDIYYYPNKQLKLIIIKTVITILIMKVSDKWWYTETQN